MRLSVQRRLESLESKPPSKRLEVLYDEYYRQNKQHSPEESRKRLIKIIKESVTNGHLPTIVRDGGFSEIVILDIGSGPQSLEKQLWNMDNGRFLSEHEQVRLLTIDRAVIQVRKLLAKRIPNTMWDLGGNKIEKIVQHVRANGTHLPLDDNSVSMAISNFAIDLMPRGAFTECFRVLAPGGMAVFNFHHPSMIPEDPKTIKNPRMRTFLLALKELKTVFPDAHNAQEALEAVGFHDISLAEFKYDNSYWWQVKALKPEKTPTITQIS